MSVAPSWSFGLVLIQHTFFIWFYYRYTQQLGRQNMYPVQHQYPLKYPCRRVRRGVLLISRRDWENSRISFLEFCLSLLLASAHVGRGQTISTVLNHDMKRDSEVWAIFAILQMRCSTQGLVPYVIWLF